ncbi:MAG: imidazolonepropionase [Actinomycetota bacterium]
MESNGALVAPVLVTPRGAAGVRGPAMDEPSVLAPGAIAWADGRITFVGDPADLPSDARPEALVDATIAPGFVDAHTHLPFVGWRADEFEARLSGATYRDQHGRGGGIPRSARMLAAASDDEVLAFCRPIVAEMAALGTTTLELKTGYGLSVAAELRQARLARALAAEAPQRCTVTLLACHAVPDGVAREDWVTEVSEVLIPAIADEGLADAVDVYVEDIAFSLDDLSRVADAAAAAGLALRSHADQLGPSGAATASARLGARSADHLNHAGPEGIVALGESETVALLLPTSTLLLRAEPAPARALVDAGAIVGLATDCNPGTSPVLSMPEAIATACALYRLTPHEALTAATLNAAAALGLARDTGSLEVGKRADLIVLEGEGFRQVPYRPGHAPVLRTVVGGATVARRDAAR